MNKRFIVQKLDLNAGKCKSIFFKYNSIKCNAL